VESRRDVLKRIIVLLQKKELILESQYKKKRSNSWDFLFE
jgi:hypothetical protein